jgi:hypothetical protein
MSKLSKLVGMAKKALDDNGSHRSADGRAGGSDWKSLVRGAADALGGDGRAGSPAGPPEHRPATTAPGDRYIPGQSAWERSRPAETRNAPPAAPADAADRAAIARYDYLLQTADPHQIEQVHREAFARLTPAQRAQVEARMSAELPAHERPRSAEAADLARAAARTQASRPGMLRGLLARAGGGRGRTGRGGAMAGAGLAAGGVLGAVAGAAVVGSVAGPLLEQAAGFGVDFDALAGNVDLDAISGGIDGIAGDIASGIGDEVTGAGERIADLGSGFDLPGLGDLFGR